MSPWHNHIKKKYYTLGKLLYSCSIFIYLFNCIQNKCFVCLQHRNVEIWSNFPDIFESLSQILLEPIRISGFEPASNSHVILCSVGFSAIYVLKMIYTSKRICLMSKTHNSYLMMKYMQYLCLLLQCRRKKCECETRSVTAAGTQFGIFPPHTYIF